jgi:hypothetical protein
LSTQPLEAACRVTYDAAQPTTSVGSGWGRFLCGRPHRVGDVLISGKSAGERPAASPGAGPAAATPPPPTPRPLSLRHRRLVFKRNYTIAKKKQGPIVRSDCPRGPGPASRRFGARGPRPLRSARGRPPQAPCAGAEALWPWPRGQTLHWDIVSPSRLLHTGAGAAAGGCAY